MKRIAFALATLGVFGTELLSSGSSSCLGDDDLRIVQRQYNQQIKPLLDKHCIDCHAGTTADAGLDLSKFETIRDLLNARKSWKKAHVRISAKEMPPAEVDPLPAADRKLLMDWIDHLLTSVDCTITNPGKVTVRRLNRTEYQNTIRDLTGVNYQPAASFPGDDVGYGFDNIADVLSLPPILMEKYLSAAEKIMNSAIVDPSVMRYSKLATGNQFEPARHGSRPVDLQHVLTTNGVVRHTFTVPESGKYRIRVRAFGDQAGDEPVSASILVNDRIVLSRRIKNERDQPAVLETLLRLSAGPQRIGIRFNNDFYDESLPKRRRDRNLHVVDANLTGPIGKLPASHRRLIGNVPQSLEDQRTSARKRLFEFTSKAYRRRASSDEIDRLMTLYDQSRSEGDGFEVSVRFAMQAVLVSPYFLYRIEIPTPAGQKRFLKDFELATNLSFFLWGTMPDAELLKLADSNQLKSDSNYRSQIARLLKDKRSRSLVDNFFAQWLQLRHLERIKPDPDLFPGVDFQLTRDMATETKLVVSELIRKDASILQLLETDFTYLNERLAKHYGIDGVIGEHFRRVSTRRSGRQGLMTQASILTLTSNPTRTSPVKRGKWIMENLLGEEPPPPAPEAMQLEDQQELKGTLRQRMEQHRADPNCAVCHRVMDELGFALENYDAVGRWRDKESTNRIDAHGELPDGTVFNGPEELQKVIRNQMRDQFVRCLTEKMLIYALGRGLEYYDECAIDKIVERLEKNDYRFSQLILGVVTSEPFIKRSGME